MPIKQIFDIILDFCQQQYDIYINRRGRFHNFNTVENITWCKIKPKIRNWDYFRQFPVENIRIKFGINLIKNLTRRQGYSSVYYDLNIDHEFGSKIINDPQSKLVDKSISLSIDIGLQIERDADYIDVNLFREYIKSNLHHEITHAYQDYNQNIKGIRLINTWNHIFNSIDDLPIAKKSHSFCNFLWIIYKISYPEMNADIAAYIATGDSDIHETINELRKFNPEKTSNEMLKDLNDPSFINIEKEFGLFFTNLYKEACQSYGIKTNKKIMRLRSHDLLYVLKFWDKIFKKRLDYIQRKIRSKGNHDIFEDE
jgi:hypothetical protein